MKTRFLIGLTLFTLAVCPTWAQSVAGLGGISGTVHDASGAAVPGASVVITNESKGIKRSIETTGSGLFSAPALVPASGYALTVTKTGFATWEVKDFAIAVGQTVDFNVAITVGSTSTQVSVTGEAPLVEDAKTGVSQVVSQAQIDNLPINGRRVDSFVLLTPAVVPDGTFGLLSFRGNAAGNSFLTDGNDTTESFYNENAGRTRISTNLSQDAVQEFQVLSDAFSAEFGRASGGVINTITRSGTNDVHGTAYWFFRNRTLNASDRYANGFNLPEWRHQAGASLGGPIKKDKIFYFANIEIIKRNFPALNRIINTSFTDTIGNILPSACTATAAQCAAATAFVSKQNNVLVPRSVSSTIGFVKIDWRPTDKNAFTFDMNAMHWRSPNGIQTQSVLTSGNALGGNGNSTVEDRFAKAAWTFTPNGTSVNEFRFGWFKDRLSDPAASQDYPAETGPLVISLNGSAVGGAAAYPRTYPSENRFQIVDNYSYVRGSHSMKFGVDFSTTEDWMNQLFNGAGTYSYSTFTNFAKDFSGNGALGLKDYSSFSQTFGNPIQDIRTTDINIYAQDSWKVTRKFTLSYGLRYEKTFIPQPTITNPNYPQTGHVNSPNKDFAPRLSFSYLINEKTVIRAGAGLFFQRFHGNGLDSLFLGNGLYQTSISVNSTAAGAPVFPNIIQSVGSIPPSSVALAFASPNFRNPYTEQGNVSIERQLARDLGMTVSYIWSHGVALWTPRDLNLAIPTTTGTYTIDDAGGNAVGTFTTPLYTAKLDTRYGRILQVENGGQSWYNALAVQLNKRMSHGLQASLAYTWSHSIENSNQGGASNNLSWTFNNSLLPGNYSADKGSTPLDQRHRAVITFLWNPTIKDGSTLVKNVINGWQLSQITTLASAQPVAETVSVSGAQFTGVSLAYTTMNGSGGWNRVPFLPVNNLDVDQTYRVDARISRVWTLKERFHAMLMFEAFNVFNTISNTGINSQGYVATAGILRPVANLGTGSASQGFPDGTNARRMQVGARFTF